MKDATQKIEAANKALKQAIEKLKAEKLQKFNEAKTALENLVKEEDAIQTGVEAAKKALDDNNKINKNSTLEEITNATKALEDAKSKLDQEIKTKKEAEFNNLTNAKTELSNLITKQAPAEAISKAKKVLEEINGLNLSNDSSIKSLKDATQKIKDAETQLTAEIEKTEKLKEFDEARKSLRELIKDDDAKEVETSKAKEALKTNKADENSSIEEIIKATKALEDAKFELNQEIRVQKDRLMDKLNAKNKKLEALLNTENLDDLMSIEKLIGLSADKIKNKLEDAKKLLQEAKGLSENSKITNIKQKIQKIDEYVRQFEPWISNMLKIKGGLVSVINSNIEQLKKFKAKKFNNNFISKLNEKLNSNIFNNLSRNMKLADLKKIEEDSVNLLRLVKLQEKYENDDKLSPSLQKKLVKEFEKILDKETIPSDSEITELENKLEKIIEEDPTTPFTREFSNLKNETKDKKEFIENQVPQSAKELAEFKNLQSWINNALRIIEEGYNLALQNNDLDGLKTEKIKIENLNKLIKLLYFYLKNSDEFVFGDYDKEQVFTKAIKEAREALNDMASINLNQEIGNDELMNEKTREIENKLSTALSMMRDHFKKH